MKKVTSSLGKKTSFQVGDLVCWTELSRKRTILADSLDADESEGQHRMVGVISKVYYEFLGGRDVAFGEIFCLKNEKKYEIPLISLKTIDKNATIYDVEGKSDEICYN